jgi:subtilase family serine protease
VSSVSGLDTGAVARPIVTNSYGDLGELEPDSVVRSENEVYMQAAAEGIGVYFASGDNGDDTNAFGHPAVDQPASFPSVTAVGGTTLAVGRDNNRLFETVPQPRRCSQA